MSRMNTEIIAGLFRKFRKCESLGILYMHFWLNLPARLNRKTGKRLFERLEKVQ